MNHADHPTPLRLAAPWIAVAGIVTLTRYLGELQGWLPREAGGAAVLLGVSWMIPLFGIWSGRSLARSGRRPPPGAALRLVGCTLLGVSIFATGLIVGAALELPFTYNLVIGSIAWPIVMAIAWRQWPAAARSNLVFAAGCRVLVIVATLAVLLLGHDDLHYAKVGASDEQHVGLALEGPVLWAFLIGVQVLLWIPMTVVVATTFGTLGARLAGSPSPVPQSA